MPNEVDNTKPSIPDPTDPEANKVTDADIEAAIKEVDVNPAPEVSEEKEPSESPADKDEPKSEELTTQQRLDELKSQFDQQQKNYEELRSKATRDWQAKAELEKQHEELQGSFEKAIQKVNEVADANYDPEQWMEDLKSQGPKKIDERIEQRLAEKEAQRNKATKEAKAITDALEFEVQFLRRMVDQESYPGFAALENKMDAIASQPDCPVNKSAPISTVLDSLYKLAVESSSGDAVKEAIETGKKEAEKQIAKEANTSLADGGKGTVGAPINLWKVPLEKLREHLPKADRD